MSMVLIHQQYMREAHCEGDVGEECNTVPAVPKQYVFVYGKMEK